MKALAEIARLEEWRCALGTSEVALERLEIAGGIASRGEPRTWVNTAVGLGLNGPVSQQEIDRLAAWYAEKHLDAQVEVCPYVDASLLKALACAGFTPRRFEMVLFRELAPDDRIEPPVGWPRDVEIRTVDPADAQRVHEWARVVADGFATPEAPVEPQHVALNEACVRQARTTAFGAYIGGECVGGGGLETLGELVALYGLSVSEQFRRRGIQQALIAARLNHAIDRGASLATISGPPGMGTERNVRRLGFQVGYTRMMMVKTWAQACATSGGDGAVAIGTGGALTNNKASCGDTRP